MDTKDFILNFLEERGIDTSEDGFDDSNFIDSGYVDSFSIMSLLMEIEGQFQYKISPEQIANSEYQSVNGLVGLLKKENN